MKHECFRFEEIMLEYASAEMKDEFRPSFQFELTDELDNPSVELPVELRVGMDFSSSIP